MYLVAAERQGVAQGALTGTLYYLLVIRPLLVRRRGPVDFGDVATWRRLIEEQHLVELRNRDR